MSGVRKRGELEASPSDRQLSVGSPAVGLFGVRESSVRPSTVCRIAGGVSSEPEASPSDRQLSVGLPAVGLFGVRESSFRPATACRIAGGARLLFPCFLSPTVRSSWRCTVTDCLAVVGRLPVDGEFPDLLPKGPHGSKRSLSVYCFAKRGLQSPCD